MSKFIVRAALLAALPFLITRGSAQEPAPDVAGEAFSVSGIEVDYYADTSEEAREAAFRAAPRQAWPRLWARLTGDSVEDAPSMSDAALSAMIDAIVIEDERFGNGRYIATLGVSFDRQRAGRRLPAGARVLQSEPMLLIPVLSEAGALSTFDPESEWYQAWREGPGGRGVVDYIIPSGSAEDRIVLNGWQATRGNRRLWRSAFGRYGADNVLTAEARILRTYPGGPITGTFTGRYGPDARPLGSFTLTASSPGEYLDMLGTAVNRINAMYVQALEEGMLETEEALRVNLAALNMPAVEIDDGFEGLGSINVSVPTPDATSWERIESALGSMPGVENFTLTSFAIGGMTQIELRYSGSEDELRGALSRRGLFLAGGPGNYRLAQGGAPSPTGPNTGEGGVPSQAPAEMEGQGTQSQQTAPSGGQPQPQPVQPAESPEEDEAEESEVPG